MVQRINDLYRLWFEGHRSIVFRTFDHSFLVILNEKGGRKVRKNEIGASLECENL